MVKDSKDQGFSQKLTPQREAVLQVIRASEDHPTANEIFEAARAILPAISYATVYNSLRYLRETGLVREINFGNSASRYDGITERHDHAICTNCGKLVDFDLHEAVELMRAAARKSRFKPKTVYLTLMGLCPDCRDVNKLKQTKRFSARVKEGRTGKII